MKLQDKLSSACCAAPVEVRGRTTHWYECQACGKACDVQNTEHEPRALASRAPCSCSQSGSTKED